MPKGIQKVGFVERRRRPGEGAALLLRQDSPERKGYAVDLDHKTSEDLATLAVWSEKSLTYARDHSQRKLVLLLGAVKADVEFEKALHALLRGEHLVPARDGYREEPTHNICRRTGNG